MKRLVLLSALLAAGCYTQDSKQPTGLASFKVEVKALTTGDGSARKPLPVVNACAARYGGSQSEVPANVRGTEDCRYSLPSAPVDIEVGITAMDGAGQPLPSFNGPVSFRVVPGDMTGGYVTRWGQLTDGQGTRTVRATHLYGEVRVWVQDEPPQVDYMDGGVDTKDGGVEWQLPPEPASRTYATGLSPTLLFEEPAISTVQMPEGTDELSAFRGSFLRIGRAPEAGPVLTQNCAADDENNGKPVTLLVTGLDPGGFFVTDLTACRVKESSLTGANTQTPEPTGFLPGRFNSLYIYNYSFPEGLDQGDLLWTLSGSVQEFTHTTQLTFPAWSIREKVRLLPQAEWNKYLDLVPPTEINGRLCGFSASPYVTDILCGYSYRDYKMESLESSLVKVSRVKFPRVFKNCDANGNATLPLFCPNPSNGTWTTCFEDLPGDPDVPERQCLVDCTLGLGEFAGTICSEKSNFDGFGQFVVEMKPTGPTAAGLDESVGGRIQRVAVSNSPSTVGRDLDLGIRVNLWCDQPVRFRFGPSGFVSAAQGDTLLAANTRYEYTLKGDENSVAFVRDATATANGTCQVAPDVRSRIQLMTRDAVPDLVVNCREDDADAERARQCRFLHGATFDIAGHLRHVGPARPRWMVIPRDQDDLCCYPGPGMECPRPIKPCP